MQFAAKAAGAAAVIVVAVTGGAQAGPFGCHERAVACYEKIKLPDVYATEARPVVVRPGYSQVVQTPPVVINRAEKVLLTPGRWREYRTPALYGTRAERVLVTPASRTYQDIPAVTRRVEKTIVVKPGSVRWEHSRGLFGREKLCKVAIPPVVKTVAHDIVVPARRIAHDTPALYKTINRPVLIQQATVNRTYEAPMYTYVSRPVVIQPTVQRVIRHAPVVGVVHEQVKVGEGGYVWARTRRGLFDH